MFFRRVALVLVMFWPVLLPWAGHAQTGANKALPMRVAPPPVVVVDVKGAIGVGTGHLIEEGLSRARASAPGWSCCASTRRAAWYPPRAT